MNYQDIIKENEKRTQALFPEYNPILGIGSLVPRFSVKISENTTVYIPNIARCLFNDEMCSNYSEYLHKYNISIYEGLQYIDNIRYNCDFEFFAAKCAVIKDKRSGKDINFILNNPQRHVHKVVHEYLFTKQPIRIDILKARKWGGSTYVQILFAWIQSILKTGWNSCIVTDVEDQARGLRAMLTKFAINFPSELGTITLAPFEGSSKNKYIPERDCIVSIGSMQKPDSLRSGTTYLLHMSEIGLWKATLGKKPEDLIQTLLEMVMDETFTCIFRESTAKGTGTYFQKLWLQDKAGESNYTPIFISWFVETTNRKPIKDYHKFIDNMNDYDWFCWKEGATFEGINWYKSKLKDYSGDHWRMMSENPTTDIEAFQSSGNRAFEQANVQKARINNCEPIFIGDIIGDAPKGKDAFKNLRLVPNPQGNLKIWQYPSDEKVSYRYVVPMDIGGRHEKADWSIIRVIDRYELLHGGVPEAIVTWTGHIDHDLLAFKGAQIAYYFDKGLFVPESNSLEGELADSEGDHIYTILQEIKDYYDNIYCRTSPDKIRDGVPAKYGWHTNKKSKPQLVSTINAAFRDEGYIEYDSSVCDEADQYEVKSNGSYGAVDGAHDDKLVCTAIGLAVSAEMPLPYRAKEIIKKNKVISKNKTAVI